VAWSQDGLAVTEAYSPSPRYRGWAITHLASGFRVARFNFRRQRDAITVATRLLDAGDWSRSRSEVTADRHLRNRAVQILDEARMLGLVNV
jgi:hypothetical protein